MPVSPGANCGSCGYKGCDDYARALVGGGGPHQPLRPRRHHRRPPGQRRAEPGLRRGPAQTGRRPLPWGLPGHGAQSGVPGSGGLCRRPAPLWRARNGTYGCLGLGDCVAVCPNRAIQVVNGVARWTPAVRGLRPVRPGLSQPGDRPDPRRSPPPLSCAAVTRRGPPCGKVLRWLPGLRPVRQNCPAGAITLSHNLAVVDSDKCAGCGPAKRSVPPSALNRRGMRWFRRHRVELYLIAGLLLPLGVGDRGVALHLPGRR